MDMRITRDIIVAVRYKLRMFGRGPAQNVPFLYTPSHLSEIQSFR